MKQYEKYFISPTENFVISNFTFVADEMAVVTENTSHVPNTFKTDMIISFLKSHSVKNMWMNENPLMAEIISSGRLVAYKTEALFEACRINPNFTQHLESYVDELLKVAPGKSNGISNQALVTD